jgi:hypothetical protein
MTSAIVANNSVFTLLVDIVKMDHIVAMNDLGQLKPQELSNLIWSCATAGKAHLQLFSKFGDHIVAMKNLEYFKPQELSNITWANAIAGESHPLLFQKLVHVAMLRCNNFNSQGIANLLWAYATVTIIDKHLFTSFVPAVKFSLGKCTNQNVASPVVANVNDPLLFNIDFVDALQSKANAAPSVAAVAG